MKKLLYTIMVISMILFVVGSYLVATGVKLRFCIHNIEVPSAFVGTVDLNFTEYRYWRNTVLNISNVTLEPNVLKTFSFRVNDTLGYINMKIADRTSEKQYSGQLAIVRIGKNGSEEVVVETPLSPRMSFEGKGLNTTLQFMKVLKPGVYELRLTMNSRSHIDNLAVYGPSSTVMEHVQPRINVETSDYEIVVLKYPCGFDRSGVAYGLTVSSIAVVMLAASAALLVREEGMVRRGKKR